MHTKIDGNFLELMLNNGYCYLHANRQAVDELNVFPVPDGDTGLNMAMTMNGGITNHTSSPKVGVLLTTFARGMLFSARGNSGVIFSQFVRGFANGAKELCEMSLCDFANAMQSGVEQAYDSVAHPVEGTMLTVIREAAEFLLKNYNTFDSFESCFDALIPVMKKSLDSTPSLLPVLAEAGVVDSGGAGTLAVFEGMELALKGKKLEKGFEMPHNGFASTQNSMALADDGSFEYGYCTEFILQLMFSDGRADDFDLDAMIKKLETLGNSIVAIKDENIVKVHVHSFNPEQVLAYAHRFGEFLTLKIENMALQHNETIHRKAEKPKHKKYVIAAVASGSGISSYFSGIGADIIINGGQTDNPSTEDFIKAFDAVDADHIIVLPNNSNIIMAAKQAAEMYSKCDVRVIATKSIAEGYSALSMMNSSAETVEELIDGMSFGLPYVTSGFITTATRDAKINGISIKKGSYIGLDRDTVLSSCDNKNDAVTEFLKNLPNIDKKEVLTAFFGKNVTIDEAENLKSRIEAEFPLLECGFLDGGQPVYDYIFAIE